jgi:tRNA1Val (adenine37-N6)-methyltransferase
MPSPSPAELTDDALAGPYRVWQRRRGHRYSLDDTLTAQRAVAAWQDARAVLDLGTGLGSVLLMLAYKLRGARLWGIEAQAESFALLERNCARNGVLGGGGDTRSDGRVRIAHGDIRDAALLERVRAECGGEGFELVTGTPPYQPLGRGTVSPDAQRAHARVELRGGVEVYVEAAARVLAPKGVLVVCADARTPERVERAAQACGLAPLVCRDVIAGEGKPALFAVWTLARAAHATAGGLRFSREPPFVARDAGGARTAEAIALRRFFDLPAPECEPPSPQLRARSQRAVLS